MAGRNAGITLAESLPAAGFDHPGGRDLSAIVSVCREHRQLGEVLQQHFHLFHRQYRVLEEAACIAQHVGVGQLAATDRDHRIGDVHRARQFHALCMQFFADAGVAHAQVVQQWQLQFNGGDQVAVRLLLEHAVAVGETALFVVQPYPGLFLAVPGLHGLDELADLGAIGADVLDRRCTGRAGNQRQVLQPGQAFLQRPHHQPVPGHAGAGADHRVVGAMFKESDFAVAEHQYGAGQVVGDQHVAAAAEHQQWAIGHVRQGQDLRQQRGIMQFQQLRCAGLHVEGVQGLQRCVAGQGPAQRGCSVVGVVHGGTHSGATAPRLGASRRRRIASTQSATSAGPLKIRPL
ncbi:hypothetical protein D3C75_427890 [compost metagenome]